MNEILTTELIQALLSAIIAIITGLFAKEKITINQYVKYTDPNDTYNIPPKGITEGALEPYKNQVSEASRICKDFHTLVSEFNTAKGIAQDTFNATWNTKEESGWVI